MDIHCATGDHGAVGWSEGHGDEGQALVEYALLLSFIALVCVAALRLFGATVSGLFAPVVAGL